jgi:hypothetical protein
MQQAFECIFNISNENLKEEIIFENPKCKWTIKRPNVMVWTRFKRSMIRSKAKICKYDIVIVDFLK